jgi:uncharacterized protein (DUF305 family)
MNRPSGPTAAATLLAVALAACGPGTRTAAPAAAPQPGPAPVPASASGPAADGGQRRFTEADARFMQHMIAHHAQALVMTALVPTHSSREDMRRLAERMQVSQRDEIAAMQSWLRERGQQVPAVDAHAGHHGAGGQHASMAGMATPAELARLAAARGAGFDRLFLELMIRHHEGALTMVAELFGTPGAGQEPLVYAFASEVDADQRMEIARMREMLNRLSPR